LGVKLLADLRDVFGVRDALATEDILKGLHAIEEAPWADLRGKPLDARGLAQRLRQYGIGSKNVRIGMHIVKGYARADLHDSWARYLPSVGLSPNGCATSATPATAADSVALVAGVADLPEANPHADPLVATARRRVAEVAPQRGWTATETAEWHADAQANPAGVLEALR
jgi:hypothetical protein